MEYQSFLQGLDTTRGGGGGGENVSKLCIIKCFIITFQRQKLDDKTTTLAQKVKGNKKSSNTKGEYFDQDDEPNTIKSKSIDAPNRFWATVEPYCADITLEDLKFLEDSIKSYEDNSEYYKVPSLGKHYSEKWAVEDLADEQELGKKASERKQSMLKSSNADNVNEMTLMDIMKRGAESVDIPADETCPFGPLTQRLISAFVEENIIAPITEEPLDTKAAGESGKVALPTGTKLMHVPHARTLEVKIQQELAAQGIIEKSDDNEVADEDGGDEVLNELKKRQAEMQVLVALNQKMKRELLEIGQTEMRKQELRHRVQSADADVLEWFRKFSTYKQNKKSPTKRERDMASNALKERETILRVLNSEEL
jgi:transcriptional adapter 3